jgi:hypothetical protein
LSCKQDAASERISQAQRVVADPAAEHLTSTSGRQLLPANC